MEDRLIQRVEVPLAEQAAGEILAFWEGIFPESAAGFRQEYAGQEAEHNADIVYLARSPRRLVGTARITIGRGCPSLGGLGEVCTDPKYRGRGIATALCARARDEFFAGGGEAIFLATSNPGAAAIYEGLGWRRLASANVMVCVRGGQPPGSFLADYFAQACGVVEVLPGCPAFRVPMIPLIVAPHAWQVMDANAGILSTRYALQGSCMGLYPRYSILAADGTGAWFAARALDGKLVGLATARLQSGGSVCSVDGFAQGLFPESWKHLMIAMFQWAASRGCPKLQARCSAEDAAKHTLLEEMGFARAGAAAPFTLATREVPGVLFEKT